MGSTVSLPAAAIGLLTLVSVALLLVGFHLALRRSALLQKAQRQATAIFSLGTLLWIILVAALSLYGFFSNFEAMPPRILFALLLPAIALAIASFTSRSLQSALLYSPMTWLFYLQTFRLFVEILLWLGYRAGTIPIQMTFEGRNFDILAGITAPIAGWIYTHYRSKAFGILWNVVGLCLLLNIIVVAVLSMPTPFRVFMNEPAATLITRFPFIFLPAVLVPIAYTAHVWSLRQLLAQQNRATLN